MSASEIVALMMLVGLLATSHLFVWTRGFWNGVDWHGKLWGPVLRRYQRMHLGSDRSLMRMRGDDGPSLDQETPS